VKALTTQKGSALVVRGGVKLVLALAAVVVPPSVLRLREGADSAPDYDCDCDCDQVGELGTDVGAVGLVNACAENSDGLDGSVTELIEGATMSCLWLSVNP